MMNKPVTVIAYFVFILFSYTAYAQDELQLAEAKDSKRDTKTYNIKSLDGKSEKITIMPDYVNRVLKISCLKDTIVIYEYWGVPTGVHMINKNFIKIDYAVRGGSGVGLGNVMILCINSGKLYEAIHVLSYSNGESGDEDDSYKIKISLIGSNKKTYKLITNVHDKVFSKTNPEINYEYANQTVLIQSKTVFIA